MIWQQLHHLWIEPVVFQGTSFKKVTTTLMKNTAFISSITVCLGQSLKMESSIKLLKIFCCHCTIGMQKWEEVFLWTRICCRKISVGNLLIAQRFVHKATGKERSILNIKNWSQNVIKLASEGRVQLKDKAKEDWKAGS